MQLLLLRDVFPDAGNYHDSRWAAWEKRVEQGHATEEKQIGRIHAKRKKHAVSNRYYDPDELAGEDYWETCRLTNSMYAALIVSIWSEMEHVLKTVTMISYQALGKRKKALLMTQKFCEDSLAGKRPSTTLDGCVKALQKLQSGIPYAFREIKAALKKELDVRIDQCVAYRTVDAIRILNNSFKHSNGCYRPESGKRQTQIDKALLKKWAIIGQRDEIDYSKLPVKKLVVACNAFCADLFAKVDDVLTTKIAPRSDNGN